MGTKIKGITVEIGGDTTKLGKALTDVNSKTNGLKRELNGINALLKVDPSNMELLAQKQDNLSEAIDTTSQKLELLKNVQGQVQAQFEKGEIAEDQYRDFQREIIATEQSLESLKNQLSVATRNMVEFGNDNGVAAEEAESLRKAVQGQKDALEAEKVALKQAEQAQKDHEKAVADAKAELKDYGEKVKDSFDNIGKATLAAGAAIGSTAIAAGSYALSISTDFDKAFNTLATKTGATKAEFDDLNESMTDVYANNFGESIEDVANAMSTVKQNTKESGDALEQTTQYALMMRDTFEFEVTESTRAAKMLMDQFGISSKDAYNLIAQGAQNGLDKNGDLLDTINEYSVHFKQLGLDAPQMFNMLVSGAESGTFSVDKLGDAIKEFGIRTKDGSDASRKAFEYLGYDADEMFKTFNKGGQEAADMTQVILDELASMPDSVEKTTAGVALFGTMWEDLGAEGIKALSELDGSINTTKDALTEINNLKYDDIGSAFEGLKRTLETEIVQPLGEEIQPVVEETIGVVKENAPQIKEIVASLVTKVGELINFLVNNGSTVISVIAGIATGLLTWNVVSVISGVVSAINAFRKANEGATIAQLALNAAQNASLMGILITIIGGIIAAIVTFIATNEDARAKFIEIWNAIKTTLGNVISSIVNFFTVTIPTAFSNFVASVKNGFNAVIGFIQTNWQALLLLIVNPFAGAFKLLYDNCEGFRNFVNSFIENIKQFFINGANNIVAFFTKTIPSLINSIVKWFNELPTKIGYALGYVLGKIVKFGVDAINWVQVNVPKIINSIVTFFKELPGKVWTWLSNTITKVTTWGVNMTTKAISIGKNFITNVINNIKELPSKLATWFTNTATKVVEFGNNLKKKGIEAGKKLLTSVSEGVKELPNKMASVGKNIVEGVWNGIKNAKDKFMKDIKNFFNGIVDGAKEALDIHSPSRRGEKEIGEEYANGVIKGVKNKYKTAKKTSAELGQILLDTAKTKLEEYKKYNDMSLTSEIAYWQKILASTKKGTQAYKDVNLELKTLKADLNKQLQDLDKSYAESVSKVKETLIKDIQAVSDKYDSAIASRASAITSSMKLFDEFTSTTDKTSEDLLNNLQSQVDGLTHWDELLDQLEARNGMNDELLAELQNIGPSAIADLENIVAMTDEQFEQYVALWTNKQQIADERAVQEYQEYRLECENEVRELVKTANTELNTLEKEYFNSLKELGVSVADESVSIGKKIVDSLKSGVESEREEFSTYLTSFFNQIISTAKNALNVSSVVSEITSKVSGAVGAATANLIELKQVQQSELLLAGGNGTSVTNNNVKNEVNINTQSVDKNNIDVIVDEINRKLGDKY